MDLPEQPTVWPPAPNITPPEPVKAKRPKLIVPGWARYWYRCGVWFFAFHFIVRMFCEADHIPVPRWGSLSAAVAAGFLCGGLLTLWKYLPRRK